MSKQSDRVKELFCQVAISALINYDMSDQESIAALLASDALNDRAESAKLKSLRDAIWHLIWEFCNDESPENLTILLLKIEKVRSATQ